MDDSLHSLQWALKRLARQQNTRLDTQRLSACLKDIPEDLEPPLQLSRILSGMGMAPAQWMAHPDEAHLPLLTFHSDHQWLIIQSHKHSGQWQCQTQLGELLIDAQALMQPSAKVLVATAKLPGWLYMLSDQAQPLNSFASRMSAALMLYKKDITEAILATGFINLLALVTSLFSMQVYDRVIPTRSGNTLAVLASGVLLTILFEIGLKYARSHLMDHVVVGLDNRLSREIFERLLSIKLDQLPPSVGSLAGQVRGYEQLRSFYTATTMFSLIDVPMGLIFLILMLMIGHPVVAMIPLVFGLISLWISFSIRKKVAAQALEGAKYANLKVGALVEVVEGMETIKSGGGSWKFLSRWLDINHHTIHNDLKTRSLNEKSQYWAAALHQISYASVVSAGAWAAMEGHITMGAVIACSILGGRVLSPIMALPSLFVQHAHAKAALEGIEKIYHLKTDHDNAQALLAPERLHGRYQIHELRYAYPGSPPALQIPQLDIQPGERVGIIGPIGSGKSTLLRILSGLYTPTQGQIQMDGLDMRQLHPQVLTESIGYLQQDHRLFQGTLRENLLIGLADPGDDVILQAMRKTGFEQVVNSHPQGLDRPIAEGGKGLSGGQKQLLAFTRLMLTQPQIWLLDEPTASMDDQQEQRCLQAIQESTQQKSLIIITHKPQILALVNRLILIVGNRIVLDGERDAVLQKLRTNATSAAAIRIDSSHS